VTAALLLNNPSSQRGRPQRASVRVRLSATALAVLIHLGLAAFFFASRTPPALMDQTPAVSVALVQTPAPLALPRSVRRAPTPRNTKPVGPPNHRLVAAPSPSLAPITPRSAAALPVARVLEPAPAIATLAPSPVIAISGGTGGSPGSGEALSGDGASAGGGGGGQGLSLVQWSAWIHRPTPAELQRFYPTPARMQGVTGMAMLACAVAADTQARRCHVLAERPPWEGFGAAALQMAKVFRIRPTLVDGKVYEKARVEIPVYFGTPVPKD